MVQVHNDSSKIWYKFNNLPVPVNEIVSVCSGSGSGERIFLATSSDIYYSSDTGSSWTLKTSPTLGIIGITAEDGDVISQHP